MQVKKRSEIDKKYLWDINSMYGSDKAWQEDVDKALELAEGLSEYRGRIAESASTLLYVLETEALIDRCLENPAVYAYMKRDEDTSYSNSQEKVMKISTVGSKISAMLAFITPELLKEDYSKIQEFIEEEEDLKVYEFALKEMFKAKEHILSETEESLLSKLSPIMGVTNNVFKMLDNADIEFENVLDASGKELELTHGSYSMLLQNEDPEVRAKTFENMHKAYKKLINTIGTNYAYNVKQTVIFTKLRKYKNVLSSALYSDEVPESVYDNLIKEIRSGLPYMHEYLEVKRKELGLEKLDMQDLYMPIFNKEDEEELTFEEAVEIMANALKPLGDEYLEAMRKGIESRWVDVYETPNKSSGAYSFGSYDSHPFILLNFKGRLRDVFTLVHEMGHSMHSYYTRKTQPYIYGGHSIFTAEVASTVNESLLINYLLDTEKDDKNKKMLIAMYLEEFRTTVFRQTMFAEFEKIVHERAEQGEELTPTKLCDIYKKLNIDYYGDIAKDNDYIQYEWARIPHFYNSFYVYKYATGFSCATAICKRILEGGDAERDDYLKFLTTGESDHPIELLKIAGVDMSKPEPVKDAVQFFAELCAKIK